MRNVKTLMLLTIETANALKRVRNYLCSMRAQEGLNKLSLISNEKINPLRLENILNFCDTMRDIFTEIIFTWK
jgi:hypothetical protein